MKTNYSTSALAMILRWIKFQVRKYSACFYNTILYFIITFKILGWVLPKWDKAIEVGQKDCSIFSRTTCKGCLSSKFYSPTMALVFKILEFLLYQFFKIFSKNCFVILFENFKIGLVKTPKYSQPVSLSDDKISLRKQPGADRFLLKIEQILISSLTKMRD